MTTDKLNLKPLHRTKYGWPLRQLRIPQAHKVTRGGRDVIVAMIDLGYRIHDSMPVLTAAYPDPIALLNVPRNEGIAAIER